jgi:NADH-quinone oxidoreductase subunit M
VSGVPWLSILVALPAAGALLVAVLPGGRPQLVKQVALLVGLLVLALTVAVALQFDAGGDQYQLAESYAWIEALGVSWSLGLSGTALALICLTAVATPLVLGAMWTESDTTGRNPKGFFALVLSLEAMVLGAFLATDVLLFYVLFEAMLIPMYFLIGIYGGPNRRYAAIKFLLYNLFGGLIMLAAVIGLYVESTQAGDGTFSLARLTALDIDPTTQRWLFVGFMIAFAIKAPLWPLHTWLPDAASEATPSNAAYLSGVVDKVGTFGMIALVVPLFPAASAWAAPVVVALAVVSILYGALLAIGQNDLVRLVAYASISHFGAIVLGIFVLTAQGLSGAAFYMVNHGLSTTALFLVVGMLVARRGSRNVADFGGVQKPAPVLAGFLLVAGLSALSLPGLSTFVSEILVLIGTFARYQWAAVLATLGIVLAAVYILLMYQRTMTGPVRPATEGTPDLRGREVLVLAPLVALLVALGVAPRPVLDVVDATTDFQVARLADAGVQQPEPLVPVAETVAEGTAP